MNPIRRIFCILAFSFTAAASASESVTTEGTVDAPVAEVWAAFTTSAGLRSWMAAHADIDLRVDGLMRANYRPEGTLGDASTIVNRILSFEPLRMLSIRVARAPDGFQMRAFFERGNAFTVEKLKEKFRK